MATDTYQDDDVIDTTARQLKAAEHLPADLMLLKMENDSIMGVARTKPRDNALILKQLVELIDAYPASADEAIYKKPVGTAIRCVCDGCGNSYEVSKVYSHGDYQTVCDRCESPRIRSQAKIKKFAEGLSIRSAESIRSVYGFTRLETRCEIDNEGKAKLTGIFVDYAAGNVTMDTRVVSPFYKGKNGGMQRTPEDRFLGVVVKAEKSKLRRDIILDSVPNIVKAAFRDHCEKKLAAVLTPQVIDEQILPAFAKYGLKLDDIERIIGTPRSMGWTEEHRLELRQILTALKNEETTVKELLSDLDDSPPENSQESPKSGASASDLTKPKSAPQSQGKKSANNPEFPEGSKTPAKPLKSQPESKHFTSPALDKLALDLTGTASVLEVNALRSKFAAEEPDEDAEKNRLCDERIAYLEEASGSK